jgi:hypothetical protein
MADPLSIPNAAEALVDDVRKPTSSWYRIFQRLIAAFNQTAADTAGKSAKEQAWQDAVLIEFADNKTYRFVSWAFPWTITSVVTRSLSGTCTLTVAINGTPLGGSANSVSASEETQAHSSANAVAAGDDIELTVSANAGAEGVSVTLKGTRALA